MPVPADHVLDDDDDDDDDAAAALFIDQLEEDRDENERGLTKLRKWSACVLRVYISDAEVVFRVATSSTLPYPPFCFFY